MDILSIINRLQEKRRLEKITPDHVPEVELMNTIHAEAKKELKIVITKRLNSKAIYIK